MSIRWFHDTILIYYPCCKLNSVHMVMDARPGAGSCSWPSRLDRSPHPTDSHKLGRNPGASASSRIEVTQPSYNISCRCKCQWNSRCVASDSRRSQSQFRQLCSHRHLGACDQHHPPPLGRSQSDNEGCCQERQLLAAPWGFPHCPGPATCGASRFSRQGGRRQRLGAVPAR